MDITELTTLMHEFVRSKGWYDEDSPKPQTPRNLSVSLALEAAEVMEHFQWREDVVKMRMTWRGSWRMLLYICYNWPV